MNVYHNLLQLKNRGEKGLFILLDPDKESPQDLKNRAQEAQSAGAKTVMLGGSQLDRDDFDRAFEAVKGAVTIPLIIFPGSSNQVSAHADAILFLSLISGRNPQYLIGEHIKAAPGIKRMGLEIIPTAYILIESGKTTAIEFVSGTKPLPRDNVDIVVAHALAGEMLGMKLVYLEAGSGAIQTVPPQMISAVAENITTPLLVGGGIRTPEQAADAAVSGADFVVVGNALENGEERALLREMVAAVSGG